MNDALKNGLENENIKTKSALENYLSTSEKSEKMTLTDQFGYTYADKLQTGLYLIAETKVPEQVTAVIGMMKKAEKNGFMMRYAIRKIRQAILHWISWLDKALTAVGTVVMIQQKPYQKGMFWIICLCQKYHISQVRQHG